jgi:dihydrolipoamide dehydrogenase
MDEAVFERKFQYSCHLKLLQTETESTQFRHVRGSGKMLSSNEIFVTRERDEKTEVLWADYIVIATGSRPRSLPNITPDESSIMTSDGIHHLDDFPKSLVIVGAGVIGCEYATMFANFGKTRVHLIDRKDRILPFEDKDISDMVTDNLQEKEVLVHREASLERLEKLEDGTIEYEVTQPDGSKESYHVEKALLSVGRIPNLEGIGMEEAGVSMSRRRFHIGDDDTQTNVPNIFAAGDATGRIALVSMGELEGRHAVEKAFGVAKGRLSYDNICKIMFLQPEVAAVGLNEQECVQNGMNIRVVKLDYSMIARAICMRLTEGFFKIIVTDDEEMKILGMRAIGEHASSAIQAVALLIKMDRGIEALAELAHPHPSIIEGVQECVRMLMDRSIFKSAVFEDKMKCYRYVDGVKVPLQRL